MISPLPSIDAIYALFARHGGDTYGENVSQLQHALQCAQLAVDHRCTDELIIASLLHDIGRMIDVTGNADELAGIDAHHEDIGAQCLAGLFGPAVTEPIRLHVPAKRYLCTIDPAYRAGLSGASILSLHVQGGAMSADERAAFEREPFVRDAVQLRRFDDWGKRHGEHPAPLEAYRSMMLALVRPG